MRSRAGTASPASLHDGRIELDTNPVERAIRPVALGRKNHLFAGSDGGGHRWAIALLADRDYHRRRHVDVSPGRGTRVRRPRAAGPTRPRTPTKLTRTPQAGARTRSARRWRCQPW